MRQGEEKTFVASSCVLSSNVLDHASCLASNIGKAMPFRNIQKNRD